LTVLSSINQEALEALAKSLSLWARPGLLITLTGDLGSGKSTFARAFLRCLANSETLEVPSPTFALIQTYSETRIPAAHIDLYRINEVSEIQELGVGELLQTHIVLVEWPERLPKFTDDVLAITLSGSGGTRELTLEASGRWKNALARNVEIEEFLRTQKIVPATRKFLEGDASSRRYETVTDETGTHVLMDMPERSDHAIAKHGKSYSALVHLADNINAVIGVNQHLHALGYSAPKILGVDGTKGLAIMERLEGEVHVTMMRRGEDMREPLHNAVDVLADMATKQWPRTVPGAHGKSHDVPDYDIEAQIFEVELMPTWYWPYLFNSDAPQPVKDSFDSVWRELLPQVPTDNPVWMMRDYHSVNIIWMPQREGLRRTGLIDTQDAMMAHPAYDLVSLLQDARVDVDEKLQDTLFDYYVSLRQKQGDFDEREFRQSYAIMGAQRNTRLLGTFTRLSKRDGKHQYLQHRPRVARYLVKNLHHPALTLLRRWYEINLPQALELAKT
jgi:N-acetylmuramate 1-kinase